MSMKKETFSSRPFEKLRKKIKIADATVAVSAPSPAPKTRKPSTTDDEELFAAAMEDVEEIAVFRKIPVSRRARKIYSEPEIVDPDREEALTILSEITSGQRSIDLSDTQEYVEWMNPEFQGEIIQRLHAGRFSVEGYLDLHGCTVPEAKTDLDSFLQESFQKGRRCVKIIHGRGLRSPKGPTLKKAVTRWLSGRYRKNIIAYVTARQCDGGLGALYVLLGKK